MREPPPPRRWPSLRGLPLRSLLPLLAATLLLGWGGWAVWGSGESGLPDSLLGSDSTPRAPSGDTLPEPVRQQLLVDLSVLAHDSMEGRRAGSEGSARARRYLVEEFASRGVNPLGPEGLLHPFPLNQGGGQGALGYNLIGVIPGTRFPGRFILIGAHYDHLGIRGGAIYNGADDNASGTAALLAIGRILAEDPLSHTLLIVAFDAEEMGLLGARAFTQAPPVPLDSIALMVNLDMISRSDSRELYAAGGHHYPYLVPLIDEAGEASPIHLLRGHDAPGLPPGDDWTLASDHGPFHQAGVPFVYFGVEDHPGYHDPSDTFEAIHPEFYTEAVTTILAFLRIADREGEALLRRAPPGGFR